jgi:hypothetical protein
MGKLEDASQCIDENNYLELFARVEALERRMESLEGRQSEPSNPGEIASRLTGHMQSVDIHLAAISAQVSGFEHRLDKRLDNIFKPRQL